MDPTELHVDAITLLDELHAFSYSDDFVDSVMKSRRDIELDSVSRECLDCAKEQSDSLANLIKVLSALRGTESETLFWDNFSSRHLSPGILQAFCFALFHDTPEMRRFGVLIYCTLIGMQPLSQLLNLKFFKSIMAIMVQASQAIQESKLINADDILELELTGEILEALSPVVSWAFAGESDEIREVVVALIELGMKLSTIYWKRREKWARMLTPVALHFLDAMAVWKLDKVLPFVVLSLLLDHFPSTKTPTVSVWEIRSNYIDLCRRHLPPHPTQTLLVIKHVLVRSPDRAVSRENAAFVACSLSKLLPDVRPLIVHVMKMASSVKTAQRTIAVEVAPAFLQDRSLNLPADFESELVKSVKFSVRDRSPIVRATALNAIAGLIPRATVPILEQIGLLPMEHVTLLEIDLQKRIIDEKLSVRKAAMRCLKAMVDRGEGFSEQLFDLIAVRTHDRAVTMRQEAGIVLSGCMRKFDTPHLHTLWFEHILPMAFDPDSKTQDQALEMIACSVLVVIDGPGLNRVRNITALELDLLERVFCVFEQKSKSFGLFCAGLDRLLRIGCIEPVWKLAVIMMRMHPEHFTVDFKGMWPSRASLPSAYYDVMALLPTVNGEIMADSKDFLTAIASETSPNATFRIIHATVAIVSKYSREFFLELFNSINGRLNAAVVDEGIRSPGLTALIYPAYLIGEIVPFVGALSGYNLNGLQLMMGAQLPNKVGIPSKLRAIACISFGKVCVWDREISSSSIPAFAVQLHESHEAAIKCNCLVVLCDLCIKWSALVDPYVLDISVCFADEFASVRLQSLHIITRLVAEDYVKLGPLIVFRFLLSEQFLETIYP
jgi:condensin-2 complex subunit D3